MFNTLCKHLFLLFHKYPLFRFVIATPFSHWFHTPRSAGPIGISISAPQSCLPCSSDPVLPGLGPVYCSSHVSPGFKLLRSKVQQILSSGSIRLFMCLFVLATCQVSQVLTIPWEYPCLSSELAWLVQAQTEGLLWRDSRVKGLVKDHEMLFGASKLPSKNAAHLCRKTGCQPLTNPVIQVLQPAAKGS